MPHRIREIPYNYTSYSDREIVIRFLGERHWHLLEELRGERKTGISARMLFEVLGDMWVVVRNPYLQEDLLEDRHRRDALIEAMHHRLDQIEVRANGNSQALELHRAAVHAVERFANQFDTDKALRDKVRKRLRKVKALVEATLAADSKVAEIYGTTEISERHRHRYEVNMRYRERLERAGLRFSGLSPDGLLPEIVEIPGHPWFIGVQFHPELKSRPFAPHPLFKSFIAAAVEQSRLV